MSASPAEVAARYVAGLSTVEDCIVWGFGRCSGGYGALRVDGKQIKATHFVLGLTGRKRPTGAYALHSCDNPPCINPRHLRWGSQAENMRDMRNRGRMRVVGPPKGLAHPKVTVSDAGVADVVRRARLGERVVDLAAEYGVAVTTIYSWMQGQRRIDAAASRDERRTA